MKKLTSLLSLIALSLMLTGCNGFVFHGLSGRSIRASNTLMSETREASGFTGIDMRTVGRVVISQGETESLDLRGPDNVVPLIRTSVRNGVLVIEMENDIFVEDLHDTKVLTITIGVKNLGALDVSGVADVTMDGLAARSLEMDLSGAGRIVFSGLSLESLSLSLSGAGDVELEGEADTAEISLTGAGNVEASGLKLRTADVSLTGLGSAKVWVTDMLTGSITGAGSIEYYGDPQTDLTNTGLGTFKSLGDK
jgi:hypothetical protein